MESLGDIVQQAKYATTQNTEAGYHFAKVLPIDPGKRWAAKAGLPARWHWAVGGDAFGLGYARCPPEREKQIRDVDSSAPLAFVGPTASGKTSLACWKAYQLHRERPNNVMVSQWHRIQSERHSMQFGKRFDYLEKCERVPVLILDDIGNEDSVTMQSIKHVVFKRHDDGLQTWVTTRLGARDFVDRYKEDTFRRLFRGGTRVFVLGGAL